jgi:hypothetical protein
VSFVSEPHLPAEVGSGTAKCPMGPDLTSQLRWAPVQPCVLWVGLRSSSIRESLAGPPVQLGTHVPNTHEQVSKVPDRGCKTCEQAVESMPARRTNRQLQCDYSIAPAPWTTRLASLQCQAPQQHGATLLTECSVAGDKTKLAHAVEDIIC